MKKITNIGCIGAGLIGQGWATIFSSAGFEVILQDVDEAVLVNALETIKRNLIFLEAHDLIEAGQTDKALKRIKATANFAEAVASADYAWYAEFS